jgi:hypothetical protein
MIADLLHTALDGAPLSDRIAAEARVFDYARAVGDHLPRVDDALLAIELVRSIELVEKVNLPFYCYFEMNRSDDEVEAPWRLEAPWRVGATCVGLLSDLYVRHRGSNVAQAVLNELLCTCARRWPNFRAGGMEPVRKAERSTGANIETELRRREADDARWWTIKGEGY